MRSYETCQIKGALPITRVATSSEPVMLNPTPGRRMDLPGFEERFVDFPDYIFRITDDIWHKRDLDYIADCYAENCLIHTQTGDITGAQTVIDNTAATLVSFPDRRLDADNVVWSKDPDPAGDIFYSSHRITSKMTNLGPSEFGPATGRSIRVTTFADCATRDNDIFEEWLVRDYGAIVRQMGHDPLERAKAQAADDVAAGHDIHAHHSAAREAMDRPTALFETPSEDVIKRLLASGWSDASLYDYRAKGDYPYEARLYGPDQIAATRADWLAPFEDIQFRADHICEVPYLGEAVDIALRWSMTGRHIHPGRYGEPTGQTIYILGISQFRVLNDLIYEEATLWDDIGVMRMIEGIRARGR